MTQHFLLSRPAKTLSLAQVFRMLDTEAEAMFRKVRWPETDGAPVCPHCGGLNAYECRRPNGLLRFRCRACRGDFTITSGTLFAFHKLPLRGYLAAIAIFCNEVKGKSALAISRDLGLSYKAAFVLLHKLREAMAEEMKGRKLGGDGKVAEIDGGYFGGYVKPANHRENRRDRRLACNQNGKRKAVVIIRERNGRSLPAVFRTEGQALASQKIGGNVEVLTDLMACPDCDNFAKQIENMLSSVNGWTVIPVRNEMSMYDFRGVALGVKDKSSIPGSAKAIVSAFRSAGLTLEIVQIPPSHGADSVFIITQQPS
jgi:transposase-like protein